MKYKLKKCPSCKRYTLKEKCGFCGVDTKEAHYKFIRSKILTGFKAFYSRA